MIKFVGDISEINKGIEILIKKLNCLNEATEITIEVKKEIGNIEVSLDGNKGAIKYQEKIHFFRAIGLFIQEMRKKSNFTIIETPKFKTNGVMLDVSRNGVLKVESIKKMLEYMALMGLNMMLLYTEDVYEISSRPYFGYMRGRYTYEELKECDDYADLLGIEMAPCIQTLGHLNAALKWNDFADVRDTEDILLAGSEKTYELIEEMIKAVSVPFRSKRIHIGMDEAHNLGLGKYLVDNGYRNRFDIMNEHLDKVREITNKYDLKPMIWSDMYFRLGSKTGEYYDREAVIPQKAIDKVPEDVQLVYWDYYHEDKESYREFIRRHKLFNRDLVFAGGIWTWNGIVAHYDKTFKTTNAGLEVCKEENVEEVFATMWGDNGTETNIFAGLLGMQLYAEHGYSEKVDMESLSERFRVCTGGNLEAFMSLTDIDYLPESKMEKGMNPSNPGKFLLWQDILIGLFDQNIKELELKKYYNDLAEKLMKYADEAGEMKFIFAVYAKLAKVLALKGDMGLRIKEYYENKNLEALGNVADNDLPELKRQVELLQDEHRKQWFLVYKPFGWEVMDIRYGGVISRINTTILRLEQYISGEIEVIEELDAQRLIFDKVEDVNVGWCNQYNRIVSASFL
jgi:hypothetical protein